MLGAPSGLFQLCEQDSNKAFGVLSATALPIPPQSTDSEEKESSTASSIINSISPPSTANSSAGNLSRRSSSIASNIESDSLYQAQLPRWASKTALTISRRSRSMTPNSNAPTINAPTDYTLPPPPTRLWNIIQVKPRVKRQQQSQHEAKNQDNQSAVDEIEHGAAASSSSTSVRAIATNATAAHGTAGRKQAIRPTTATERKISRKTAHSIIERRRRTKINEEFGTLKVMVPTCARQEMHKLAILQATIDYMCYLERSIIDLKATHACCPRPPSQSHCGGTPTIPTQHPIPAVNSKSLASTSSPGSDPQNHEMPVINPPISQPKTRSISIRDLISV